MTTAKKLMTAEEFFDLPDDGRRLELLDGEVVELTPPHYEHGAVTDNTSAVLREFVRPRGLGSVSVGNPGCPIASDPDRVRGPDVCFIRQDRLPPREARRRPVEVMPDLVVEVISPNDRATAVQQKTAEWLAAGVRLVWNIYPDLRQVVAFRSLSDVRTSSLADTLDAEPVLPGFACPAAALFE